MRIEDAILGWRDRKLADPVFQRWASRFPLTRRVATRRAQAAFDLCAGFVYSQALLATMRCGLLACVSKGPVAMEDAIAATGLGADRARLLIDAAMALDLVEARAGGRVGLGSLGAAISANSGVAAMVEHHGMVYSDLADPVALLQGRADVSGLRRFWPYAGEDDEFSVVADDAARYSALMTASQAMLAEDIITAYPFARHKSVLDIGGGEGAFLTALGRSVPGLALTLLDLPPVAARAAAGFEVAGFGARARAIGGSFADGRLPAGHDLMTLVRVAHDHDDSVLVPLLRNIHASLEPGGVLLVAEPMAGVAQSRRVADVYFAFYLLAMGSGQPRSFERFRDLLRDAGFTDVRRVPTARPMLVSMLSARR